MNHQFKRMLMAGMMAGILSAGPALAQSADVETLPQEAAPRTTADEDQAQKLAELKLEYLIREDFWRFERQIQNEAIGLPVESRYRLYLDQRIEETYPASFLNAFPGLGVGSFSMGDTAGGWALVGGELAGAALAVLGTAVSGGSTASASVFTGLGTLVIAGFRLYGIFRPLDYAGDYNARLQRALELRPSLNATLTPGSIDLTPGSIEMPVTGLRMSWQF